MERLFSRTAMDPPFFVMARISEAPSMPPLLTIARWAWELALQDPTGSRARSRMRSSPPWTQFVWRSMAPAREVSASAILSVFRPPTRGWPSERCRERVHELTWCGHELGKKRQGSTSSGEFYNMRHRSCHRQEWPARREKKSRDESSRGRSVGVDLGRSKGCL